MQEILNRIRNFCIIAHIDHGKSTLADRFLEFTGAVEENKLKEQFLDNMELERERGITIKAKAVRLNFSYNNQQYILNLIDTPGHVDFTYEVVKSLKACEGAVLLVDATQGIEAQTVANFYLALENNLKIIPVINKIDLANADVNRTKEQLKDIFGFKEEEISLVSAKNGIGVKNVLERIIKEVPPPQVDINKPLKAILFDCSFDPYRGVVLFLRVFDGKISTFDSILFIHQNKIYKVEETGVFLPKMQKKDFLLAGEVGYIICNIKDIKELNLGDTITLPSNPTDKPFEGYKKIPPMVFCGIFPTFPKDYVYLREAIEKLNLSDPSFVYEPDNLGSLGYGFRCGFLGLLHMEIIQERLEREFNLDLILTSPTVMYKIKTKDKKELNISNPDKLPSPNDMEEILEPMVKARIIAPIDDLEAICELAKSKRGTFLNMDYLGKDRLNIEFKLPLSEIIVDFYDKIKSITRGYGSLDYEFIGYEKTDIVKIDILFNQKKIEAFSLLVHKDKKDAKARAVVEKLKEIIPRQMFEINIQAAVGSKIIASERIPPLRKNVTAKCYGGDITRKRKLWEKQKEGKKKLKQIGNVNIPPNAFLEVLKISV